VKLIDNASKWYRMFSVQALLFIGVVQGIMAVLTPETMGAQIPFTDGFTYRDLGVSLTVAAAVIGGIGRLIDQGAATTPKL